MKTFNDLKVGDKVYFGRYFTYRFVERSEDVFEIDCFTIIGIRKTEEGLTYKLEIKESSQRFDRGFKFDLFVKIEKINNPYDGYFFLDYLESTILLLKMRQLSYKIKCHNYPYRKYFLRQLA